MRWTLGAFALFYYLVVPVFAGSADTSVFCGFKEYQWNDVSRRRNIKVAAWYPTHDKPAPVSYGPFKGLAAPGGAIQPGKHPLVIISHGTGGHRFNQFFMSEELAANGYIVLAVQHPRNCAGDEDSNSDADLLVNLWNRPKDISFALDEALRYPELSECIDPDRMGVIGHSLGGYTALVLAGAKPDIGHIEKMCGSFRGWFAGNFCKSKASELDAWRRGKFLDFGNLQDTRLRAAFVMAPGVPILFDKAAMARVHAPVFVLISGRDEILKGREQAYRRYLPPTTTFLELPEAGHHIYLMECTGALKKRAAEVCIDMGTPRAELHPMINQKALLFFDKVLKASK